MQSQSEGDVISHCLETSELSQQMIESCTNRMLNRNGKGTVIEHIALRRTTCEDRAVTDDGDSGVIKHAEAPTGHGIMG